jgi:hypothetical protein
MLQKHSSNTQGLLSEADERMLQREIDELHERKAYDLEFRKKFNQELNTTPKDFNIPAI